MIFGVLLPEPSLLFERKSMVGRVTCANQCILFARNKWMAFNFSCFFFCVCADTRARSKLMTLLHSKGSPLKVIPPPPRGGAGAADDGIQLAQKLLASTSINAEQFVADQKKAMETLKAAKGKGKAKAVAYDDDDDDEESDTDGEVDI